MGRVGIIIARASKDLPAMDMDTSSVYNVESIILVYTE